MISARPGRGGAECDRDRRLRVVLGGSAPRRPTDHRLARSARGARGRVRVARSQHDEPGRSSAVPSRCSGASEQIEVDEVLAPHTPTGAEPRRAGARARAAHRPLRRPRRDDLARRAHGARVARRDHRRAIRQRQSARPSPVRARSRSRAARRRPARRDGRDRRPGGRRLQPGPRRLRTRRDRGRAGRLLRGRRPAGAASVPAQARSAQFPEPTRSARRAAEPTDPAHPSPCRQRRPSKR